jgi:DNA repair photolyase
MDSCPPVTLPSPLRRGRAATQNRSSRRIVAPESIPEPDAWDEEELAPVKTEVTLERPRTVINRQRSPDLPFDRSINAYRGCEHGCIYCYARPTHAYLGLSPGLDFETRLVAKMDVAALLERELGKRAYRPAPIALGTNTDPYQPIERRYRTTRAILAVLERWSHPVMVTTKSASVCDDLPILARMAERKLAQVHLSITTLDHRLARHMEPRASTPSLRLKAISALAKAGVPVAVFVSPLIPGLTDHELEAILTAARSAGATCASTIPLRLPHEVAPLFEAWLLGNYPDKATKVLAGVRAIRDGKLNDPRFAHRFSAQGKEGEMLQQRFALACSRLGLSRTLPALDCSGFGPPPSAQLSLFAAQVET